MPSPESTARGLVDITILRAACNQMESVDFDNLVSLLNEGILDESAKEYHPQMRRLLAAIPFLVKSVEILSGNGKGKESVN